MSRTAKATDFLSKMNLAQAEPEPPAQRAPAAPKLKSPPAPAEAPRAKPARAGGSSRAGLKHIGAYLDRDTVEKVALLRARLALDNSELVKLAVERLYAAEAAKRKFGDA
jgi:hypothetical protein